MDKCVKRVFSMRISYNEHQDDLLFMMTLGGTRLVIQWSYSLFSEGAHLSGISWDAH